MQFSNDLNSLAGHITMDTMGFIVFFASNIAVAMLLAGS